MRRLPVRLCLLLLTRPAQHLCPCTDAAHAEAEYCASLELDVADGTEGLNVLAYAPGMDMRPGSGVAAVRREWARPARVRILPLDRRASGARLPRVGRSALDHRAGRVDLGVGSKVYPVRMAAMKISQLAERSGIPATTLRYYESEGLLPADRTPSGYRTYETDALERLAFIAAAKHLGLALHEIRDLLTVWQDGPCSQVRASLRPMINGRLADAERRAAQLEAFAASLRDALNRLDALPDRHTSCDPACPFLSGQAIPSLPSQAVPTTVPTLPSQAIPATASTNPWRQALNGASREPIPGGWRFILPTGRAATLAALAVAEQSRHPGLAISLHLRGPSLRLELTAGPEHDGLIDGLIGSSD